MTVKIATERAKVAVPTDDVVAPDKAKLLALIEKYKIQNPVRYERVKPELERQLGSKL